MKIDKEIEIERKADRDREKDKDKYKNRDIDGDEISAAMQEQRINYMLQQCAVYDRERSVIGKLFPRGCLFTFLQA